ncbi:3-deoxy-D-arabinoheptulosonate-7-phosphate synthase [Marinobacter daqiaonensis]|uniref:Phospho-2-dehydro-3-deoxyheptonate aldolase n=1 Tax=Marinobacter daqiaonensis TaxID=650891 RepID=A0A1I6JTI4_9GAMM|nr:3-deoxy-7-phosphoheptulonate synthase [Marinobacter daqiaonensis]SFR82277.1 3-deoxy-D-arabinoheptulosonate-7-phosphate synthase [Marinobacter daqiaonensis]
MNMPLDVRTTNEAQTVDNNKQDPLAPASSAMLLATPSALRRDIPRPDYLGQQIDTHRQAIRRILDGQDERLLVVVGPCSIHDEVAALEYGEKLAALADEVSDRMLIVMRAYLEKPRTTVGWKGLLYDPERTGDGNLAEGLIRSRRLLVNLAHLGLPLATEALSPMAMDYLDDLISWTAIGARTTESQIHRELVSGLPMPTGFKNGTDGSFAVAVNAMKSAAHSHHRIGFTQDGQPAMITTAGNPHTHLVLRGGRGITNYDADSVQAAVDALSTAGVNTSVMVDCSHDNACKQPERQPDIAREVIRQRRAGNHSIKGLMIESFLAQGRQDDGEELVYGQSITDPCLGWEDTEALLRSLA